jgi:predicted GH43/DUF377 family glycosyl hydrolase
LRRWLCTGLSIGAFALAAAWAPLAWGSSMQAPSPYRPKDFALIKKDGVYHLFYIRRNTAVSEPYTENDLGHATSYDLYNWTQQDSVLPTSPDAWDNQHIWAPAIVLRNGVYSMLYCGVSNVPGAYSSYQRIGLATSTDLYHWTRSGSPVFSCDQAPWAFCNPLNADQTGCRDPFVMPDAAKPGGWLMVYTANSAADSNEMVVGLAATGGDFTAWSDVKPLWITATPTTGSTFAESPHVFQHDGLWFLFFTINGPQGIAFATTPDPRSDPAGWTYRGTLNNMLGIGSTNWYASEYFKDGTNEYFCYANGTRIEFNLMHWTAPDQFTIGPPDPFHITTLGWSATSVQEGQPAALQIASVNGLGANAALEAQVLDATGQWVVVPPDSVGLPAAIPITADTTVWSWTARRWPSGSTGQATIMVRAVDQTAATPAPILVMPAPVTAPAPVNAPAGDAEEHPKLHIVRFAAPAGRVRLGFELDRPGPARLELFDVQGRRVTTLARGSLSGGSHVVEWDGRGPGGRPAQPGLYLVRLVAAGQTATLRVGFVP